MHFDPTVNLGTIISATLLIGAMFKIYGNITNQITGLSIKVEELWKFYNNRINETPSGGRHY